MGKAVFLDKDGTIVKDMVHNVAIDKMQLMPGVESGLKLLSRNGYKIFVITNQPGVAHGYFSEDAVITNGYHLGSMMLSMGVPLSGFYYCPHHPKGVVKQYATDCLCRKPEPGLIIRAAHEHNIAINDSWFVGDILDDVEAGRKAGCRTVMIDGGSETEWTLSRQRLPHHIVRGLEEAAQVITSLGRRGE